MSENQEKSATVSTVMLLNTALSKNSRTKLRHQQQLYVSKLIGEFYYRLYMKDGH